MHLVYFRAFLKIFLFFFTLLFIIFFVVYGYRYNKNIGFVQKNVFMTLNFWSDDNSIKVGNYTYFPEDKKVSLYNLDSGCYSITYNDKTAYKCFQNNQSSDQVFVTYEGKRKLSTNELKSNCYEMPRLYHEYYCIKDKCFSDKILDAATYGNIAFLQTSSTLYSCDTDFDDCSKLSNFTGQLLCANQAGVISLENDGYYLNKLR